MGEVKLIGTFVSPFYYRVQWALKLKGIQYEYIEEDLQNKSPLLLKSNPINKQVPVLLHRGKPVAESLVILEYIEETWKENPLLPEDPYERAIARFFIKFTEEKCFKSLKDVYNSKGEEQKKAAESAVEAMKVLEEEIKGKKFFGGESISLVDVVLGWFPHWLPLLEDVVGIKIFDQQTFPSLHQWCVNFLRIPIIKESLPPYDRLKAHMASRRSSPKN